LSVNHDGTTQIFHFAGPAPRRRCVPRFLLPLDFPLSCLLLLAFGLGPPSSVSMHPILPGDKPRNLGPPDSSPLPSGFLCQSPPGFLFFARFQSSFSFSFLKSVPINWYKHWRVGTFFFLAPAPQYMRPYTPFFCPSFFSITFHLFHDNPSHKSRAKPVFLFAKPNSSIHFFPPFLFPPGRFFPVTLLLHDSLVESTRSFDVSVRTVVCYPPPFIGPPISLIGFSFFLLFEVPSSLYFRVPTLAAIFFSPYLFRVQ